MRLLFAITISSFSAVLWVALALARHIRFTPSIRARRSLGTRRWFTQEFFEAGEFRTPRALRLRQEVLRARPSGLLQTGGESDADAAVKHKRRILNPRPLSIQPIPIRAAASGLGTAQSGEPVPAKKGAVISISAPMSSAPTSGPTPGTRSIRALHPAADALSDSTFGQRRPPQPSRPHGVRRVDLAQYSRPSDDGSAPNTEMGDLSDPYTHSLRGSETQGPVLKRL
jgi:hypothetical protein